MGFFERVHKQALVISIWCLPLSSCPPLLAESHLHHSSANSPWENAHTQDFIHAHQATIQLHSACKSLLLRFCSQPISPQKPGIETMWGWAHVDSQVTSPYWIQNYPALPTINTFLSGQSSLLTFSLSLVFQSQLCC